MLLQFQFTVLPSKADLTGCHTGGYILITLQVVVMMEPRNCIKLLPKLYKWPCQDKDNQSHLQWVHSQHAIYCKCTIHNVQHNSGVHTVPLHCYTLLLYYHKVVWVGFWNYRANSLLLATLLSINYYKQNNLNLASIQVKKFLFTPLRHTGRVEIIARHSELK